jgi:methionyl-tRNA formyltransferase
VRFFAYSGLTDLTQAAEQTRASLALAAGWYHMIPSRVRAAFACGCAGLHASLLPRYRGGAPLSWAIIRGERDAGVSCFQLSDGVDDGPLFGQRKFSITETDYIGDVLCRAEEASLALVSDVVPGILDGTCQPYPQQGEPICMPQRTPDDGTIDWGAPAIEIARLVRAVSRPYPGARSSHDGQLVIIWRARPVTDELIRGVPGEWVERAGRPPAVVTGKGALEIEEAEWPGATGSC